MVWWSGDWMVWWSVGLVIVWLVAEMLKEGDAVSANCSCCATFFGFARNLIHNFAHFCTILSCFCPFFVRVFGANFQTQSCVSVSAILVGGLMGAWFGVGLDRPRYRGILAV